MNGQRHPAITLLSTRGWLRLRDWKKNQLDRGGVLAGLAVSSFPLQHLATQVMTDVP